MYTIWGEKEVEPFPAKNHDLELNASEKKHSGGLMRINHVGEVCAQGLYSGARIFATNPKTYQFMVTSQQEERLHLAWCQNRLNELDTAPSVFNPIFYAGSFALGFGASLWGDAISLGFVVETERQVEAHLADQQDLFPKRDLCSKEIISQMEKDEKDHADKAFALKGQELPSCVKHAMSVLAQSMKWIAYRI